MIHVLDAGLRQARRWLSRSEWSLRFLNLSKLPEADGERGLVLIQIDGLSRTQLEKAIKRKRMPFLRKLMKREGYHLHTIYSGIPSSTAVAQGELFYGVKCCIPAFGYFDRKEKRFARMLNPECARRVEEALGKLGKGICDGGSSYSNIYSAGAKEAHWCASGLGAANMLRSINPLGFLVVVLWNIPSVARLIGLLFVEMCVSVYDAVRGAIRLKEARQELLFIFSRVFACVGLRELITVNSSMDVTRGLPVVHVNFVGYDEQSHRRGPSSKFAHFSLRGIDNCIKRIWTAAHRSSRRDYDVWIYSDHGQEHTTSYAKEQGRSLEDAVAEALGEEVKSVTGSVHPRKTNVKNNARKTASLRVSSPIRSEHFSGHKMEEFLLKRTRTHSDEEGVAAAAAGAADAKEGGENAFVVALGPLGHIYFGTPPRGEALDAAARRLVEKAGIPMVLRSDGDGRAVVFTSHGRFELPRDAVKVLGQRHAFPDECSRDLVYLCRHADAGDLVICGWRPEGRPLSFVAEHGGHGGCGAEETRAFGIFPGNAPLPHHGKHFRYAEIREAAMHLRGGAPAALTYQRRERAAVHTLRVMTYNVHGCHGMDGKISTARIARVIAHYEPDVVALQECYGARKGDQARAIAAELMNTYHFPESLHVEQDDYGNAVLSVHPMRLLRAAELPTLPAGRMIETRGALLVGLDVAGTRLLLVNTHFGLFSLERQRQAEAMMGEAWLGGKECEGPVILCGDFNALPSSSAYRIITARLHEAQATVEGHRPRNTFWGRYPLSRIDHIFCTGDFETLGVEVPRTHLTRLASDHLPLIAELGFAGRPQEPSPGAQVNAGALPLPG